MKALRWIGHVLLMVLGLVFLAGLVALAGWLVWGVVSALNPYLQHGYGWLTLVIGAAIGFAIGALATERSHQRKRGT